jgi:deoxyribodipyrimidine photo-lyase
MSKSLAIAWFRQDLRIHDNPALNAAAECDALLPIYILDDVNAAEWAMGGASRVWLHHSLQALNAALDGRLQLFVGDARTVIRQLVEELDVDAVYWNRCYEPWRMRRDALIKQDLAERNIDNRSFSASLLWEPWTVSKQDGTPYRVFTPYYQKGCLNAAPPRQPLARAKQLHCHAARVDGSRALDELGLLPSTLDWHEAMRRYWAIGESAALERLQRFCDECLDNYKRGRDFPGVDATSKLSPHLHFGEISPHQL